jgi:hypothetical protein
VGKEPDRLTPAERDPSPLDIKRLEREIAESRKRLSDLVAELDRRRHELLSFRARPLRTAAIALVGAAVAGGAAAVLLRGRSRLSVRKRARDLGKAFGRIFEHPERVASDAKSPFSRIAIAVVPILVKKIADRALERRRR